MAPMAPKAPMVAPKAPMAPMAPTKVSLFRSKIASLERFIRL